MRTALAMMDPDEPEQPWVWPITVATSSNLHVPVNTNTASTYSNATITWSNG